MSLLQTLSTGQMRAHIILRQLTAGICTTLLLAACGGGGGASSPTRPPTNSGLSQSQDAFESVALSQNGGMHYVLADLSFTTTNSGFILNPSSVFFTQNISVPASPSTGPQPLSITLTSLISTLATPGPATPERYMVDGTVEVAASPAVATVTYPGVNVQTAYVAADGKTVVYVVLGTSYVVTPLSGLVSASPSQVFSGSGLGVITNKINGTSLYNLQSTWSTGAAFVTIQRQISGDTLEVDDCSSPTTTGTSLTPCSSSAAQLSAFFPFTDPSSGITYRESDGQVQAVAGVTSWVSNAPIPIRETTTYRVFYQTNNEIFGGYLVKSGTTIAISPLGGGAPQDFEILFNEAAVQSIEAAVTF